MSLAQASFALVCEGETDRRVATLLADRVLLFAIDWIDRELLDQVREWRGLRRVDSFLPWARVREASAEQRVRPRAFGGFPSGQARPDAYAARLCLLTLAAAEDLPEAVILLRDSDGDRDRGRGLEQARADYEWPFAVAIGLAHPKIEAWLLVSFRPGSDGEREILGQLRGELGFDPTTHAERLDAREHGAKTDAKRVLSLLTGGDVGRAFEGIEANTLESLGPNPEIGLADYLDEVRTHLVPVLTGAGRRTPAVGAHEP